MKLKFNYGIVFVIASWVKASDVKGRIGIHKEDIRRVNAFLNELDYDLFWRTNLKFILKNTKKL